MYAIERPSQSRNLHLVVCLLQLLYSLLVYVTWKLLELYFRKTPPIKHFTLFKHQGTTKKLRTLSFQNDNKNHWCSACHLVKITATDFCTLSFFLGRKSDHLLDPTAARFLFVCVSLFLTQTHTHARRSIPPTLPTHTQKSLNDLDLLWPAAFTCSSALRCADACSASGLMLWTNWTSAAVNRWPRRPDSSQPRLALWTFHYGSARLWLKQMKNLLMFLKWQQMQVLSRKI